ncbi:hypothetical protein PHMEG_00010146 [Phytophthora megakarya]|uniref:RxLR effector protein n=1 Tax=Phytophthora megakarya TaxID=4795 RepID=A0A225WFS0_9STRA|nr:hypothetical protein PHMEG_00010146 [Phytophthora megakarya]
MRMLIIVVFFINIFCAGIGVLSTSEQETTWNATPLKRSLAATTTEKSLRMQTAAGATGFGTNGGTDDEERVHLQGLSALAILDKETWTVSKLIKDADYRIWAKKMLSPEKVFTGKFHIRVAREAIDNNKKVVQCFRYRRVDPRFKLLEEFTKVTKDTTATKRSLRTQEACVVNPSDVHVGVNNYRRANIQALSLLNSIQKLGEFNWLFWKKNPKRLFEYFNLHKAGFKIDEKAGYPVVPVCNRLQSRERSREAFGRSNLLNLEKSEASEAKLALSVQAVERVSPRDQGEIPESIGNVVRNIFSSNRLNWGTDSAQLYNIAKEYVRFAFGLGAGLR